MAAWDTAQEVFSEIEIQGVKRDWEKYEMRPDLIKKHFRKGHLPSIYNAALNNKSGWATVANAIIKYRLPQLPYREESDGVTEHSHIVSRFCCDLLDWMKQFAVTALAYWRTEVYRRARATSALQK